MPLNICYIFTPATIQIFYILKTYLQLLSLLSHITVAEDRSDITQQGSEKQVSIFDLVKMLIPHMKKHYLWIPLIIDRFLNYRSGSIEWLSIQVD